MRSKIKNDIENKNVQSFLKVIKDNYEDKVTHDGIIKSIQQLFEEGFEVRSPDGTKKINSKVLQQAIWPVVQKQKFLDFQIHGTGKDELTEKIVTDGVFTVMDEGGLTGVLHDKNGVFWQSDIYGDSFVNIGTDADRDYPVTYTTVSPSNIYTDCWATGIRTGGKGKNATKMVVVYPMSQDEAKSYYPDKFKRYEITGKIPRDLGIGKEQERTWNQEQKQDKDKVEIAYSYDCINEKYTVFAGSQCTILEEGYGEDYPFVMNNVPYIPIVQFLCIPSSQGFFNYGIGHMLYDLAVISRRMLNMAVGHVSENVFPITLVNVAQGEAAKFFNKLQLAEEMRAKGKKGFVALEYDPMNPNASRVAAEGLTTPSLLQEWQVIYEQLTREIARLGIMLDAPDRGTQVTATQIVAEEEAQNAFVKQIMEYNASSCKFIVELTMDFIKKFVKKNNKTPLNLTTNYFIQGQEVRMDTITLGGLADELKNSHYFVKVNARSGALPSNVMKLAQITRMMTMTPPGSPAFTKLQAMFARYNDMDFNVEDFGAPEQSGAQEAEMKQMPTETEHMSVAEKGASPMPL